MVLEVFYNFKEGTHEWNFYHKLNSFLLVGLLEAIKDDLIQDIRQATDEKFGEDEDDEI